MREHITHPSAAYRTVVTRAHRRTVRCRVLDTTRGVGKILSFSASQLLSFSAKGELYPNNTIKHTQFYSHNRTPQAKCTRMCSV